MRGHFVPYSYSELSLSLDREATQTQSQGHNTNANKTVVPFLYRQNYSVTQEEQSKVIFVTLFLKVVSLEPGTFIAAMATLKSISSPKPLNLDRNFANNLKQFPKD